MIGRYPAQLDALHREAGGLVSSPAGYLLASPAALAAVGALVAMPSLNRLGLACVRVDEPGSPRFADGLLDLHRTVLRDALEHTVAYLDGRTSEGSTLLARPQLQAELADVAIELNESGGTRERGHWSLYQRLTKAGRGLLRLLGASSMLADGPGGDLYLAEFAGCLYVRPAVDDD